jgi:formylmethanofuran dehydrogenase subunit C
LITLSPKYAFNVPVDVGNVTPNHLVGKSVDEITSLLLWEGNRQRRLDDLFVVEYTGIPRHDMTIQFTGDLIKLKRVGAHMSHGQIVVEGSVGMRLGEGMKGGEITVKGNADSWIGTMMEDGKIEVSGNVGDYVGASYRGSTEGMNGGTIIVGGHAGSEVGCFMRHGFIKVRGDIGLFAGMHMRGGTIFIAGNSEGHLGAQMLEGKIIVLGNVPSVLPSFNIDSIRKSVKVENEKVSGPFYMFRGDLADNGNGRLYLSQNKNPRLSFYEKYLTI